jgi:type IV secretion system protein VirB9
MKIRNWTSTAAICLLPGLALAQQVPDLATITDGMEPLPPVRMVSPAKVKLDAKEAKGVKLADKWKATPDLPTSGEDGEVQYLFGSTLPTLVCSPTQVCAIRLQVGEVVNDVHVGDKVRWKVTPATAGKGATETTLVIVKPIDAGLSTNLIVTTDRRVYTIKLISSQRDWMPVMSFFYPDEAEKEWAAYRERQDRETRNNTLPTGQNIANLDFNFSLKGDSPSWKPVRVYTDGTKTYIQFPAGSLNGTAPALVALGMKDGLLAKRDEEIVNYRVIGDRYVVDKVLGDAALIVGVGSKQTRVTIHHQRG